MTDPANDPDSAPLDVIANERAAAREANGTLTPRRFSDAAAQQLDPEAAARVGRFVSPKSIRHVLETEARAQARVTGRAFDENLLATPAFVAWIAQTEAGAREAGNLVTDMQYADLLLGRSLQVGDKARYVGPTRAEERMGKEGRSVVRPHGQKGTVIRASRRSDGRLEVTFQPDLEPKVRDAALRDEVDVPQIKLTVADNLGGGYFYLERVPG